MSRVHHIKQNDTKPYITDTLKDASGNTVDLTGSTVVIIAKDSTGAVKINRQSGSHNDSGGVATYMFATGDTDTAGTFPYEWEVTYAGGDVQTFPTVSTNFIIVHGELG